MTPQEKAVIEAAMKIRLTHLNNPAVMAGAAASDLIVAVDALIYSCPRCNAGGHTCPGDGNPIGHTATDCGRHEICGSRGMAMGSGCIRRAGHRGGHGYGDGSGEQDGPEPTASTYPCWECLTDPTEDPIAWCDDRPEDFGRQDPSHPCRLRAHAPDRCLNRPDENQDAVEQAAELLDSPAKCVCSRTERVCCAADDCHGGADEPKWVETTMTNCLINDRIRLGSEETTVIRSNHGMWHANTANAWQPQRWDHIELRMELEAVPGFKQYPPSASIEILCTPERLAVLRIQEAFPGSASVSSHVD